MVSQLLVEISVLFLMMALGFAVVRMGLLKADDSRVLTVLSVYVIIPAVIVNSFQIELTSDVVHLFMLAIAAAVLIHILLYLVAWIAGRALHLSVLEKASIIYSNELFWKTGLNFHDSNVALRLLVIVFTSQEQHKDTS